MDKDAVLGFIKKNMLSLSCGVVALLCIGAYFYPLGGMQDELQQKADERGKVGAALTALIKQDQRKLPIHDLDATDPGTLHFFPNKAAIEAGNAAKERWKEYSDHTVKLLVDLNRDAHAVMMPNMLNVAPDKRYDPDYLDFPKLYLQVVSTDPTVTGVPDKNAKPPVDGDPTLVKYKDLNIQNDILHGGMPPSAADFDTARVALWEGTYKQQLIEANGVVVNQAEVTGRFTAEVAGLQLKMEKIDARKYRVYVDQDAFGINTRMVPGARSTPEDMWFSQMQVWIDQDVARAIAEANSQSANVLDAPVKRLLRIDVPPAPMYTLAVAATAGGQQGQAAAPVPASANAPIVPNYALSVVGRYSNPMYDVVTFRLMIDVDATQVNQVLETLSRKTFMTVTEENEYALSAESEFAKGYLYGHGSVVRLDLTLETMFFRDWTKPLMCDYVKGLLGLMAPTAAATPSAPPAGYPGGGGMIPRMGMPPGGPGGYPPPNR